MGINKMDRREGCTLFRRVILHLNELHIGLAKNKDK
jgi:hypothetical protein